eukprot:480544-Rhodomonas_salina.1
MQQRTRTRPRGRTAESPAPRMGQQRFWPRSAHGRVDLGWQVGVGPAVPAGHGRTNVSVNTWHCVADRTCPPPPTRHTTIADRERGGRVAHRAGGGGVVGGGDLGGGVGAGAVVPGAGGGVEELAEEAAGLALARRVRVARGPARAQEPRLVRRQRVPRRPQRVAPRHRLPALERPRGPRALQPDPRAVGRRNTCQHVQPLLVRRGDARQAPPVALAPALGVVPGAGLVHDAVLLGARGGGGGRGEAAGGAGRERRRTRHLP